MDAGFRSRDKRIRNAESQNRPNANIVRDMFSAGSRSAPPIPPGSRTTPRVSILTLLL